MLRVHRVYYLRPEPDVAEGAGESLKILVLGGVGRCGLPPALQISVEVSAA